MKINNVLNDSKSILSTRSTAQIPEDFSFFHDAAEF